MISRRLLMTVLAMAPLPEILHAQDPGPGAAVSQLDQALMAALQAGKNKPFKDRYNILAPVIDQVFDLASILRTSVGLIWSQLPADQQAELAKVFRVYTVCSYAANFDDYSGQRIDLLPDTRTVGQDTVVATQIVGQGGTTRIDYVMRQTDGAWKVVDVLLNGSISRVAVQRSDFRSLVAGGSAAPLIASLNNKIKQLSGGAVSSTS
jgi:phospholipid transport system substrate-binding protein